MAPLHPLRRQERLELLWGRDLYEDLVRLNQLDLELFRRAENEVWRRIALVPKSDRRLAEFRMRCSRLGETGFLTADGKLAKSGAGTQLVLKVGSEARTPYLSAAKQG
jgi:hypothetical protein